jgi:hypothetical protein
MEPFADYAGIFGFPEGMFIFEMQATTWLKWRGFVYKDGNRNITYFPGRRLFLKKSITLWCTVAGWPAPGAFRPSAGIDQYFLLNLPTSEFCSCKLRGRSADVQVIKACVWISVGLMRKMFPDASMLWCSGTGAQ